MKNVVPGFLNLIVLKMFKNPFVALLSTYNLFQIPFDS